MLEQFQRTEMLLGELALERLAAARVAVFGIGGVGGYVVEALVRSGIGAMDIVDNDTVDITNLNRQIIATHSNLGKNKVDVMHARILDINPECKVTCHKCFYLPETREQFDFSDYDYVVDAIDTVAGKLALVEQAHEAGVPIISSMGAGNKLDPTAFEVADISQTSVDPLARVIRRELKHRGIEHLKVVYSKEKPVKLDVQGLAQPPDSTYTGADTAKKSARTFFQALACESEGEMLCADIVSRSSDDADASSTPRVRKSPGSIAFVPSVAGLIIASEVIKDIAFDIR